MSEYRDITPTCRINRGTEPAWDEAVRGLREAYIVMQARHPGATFRLKLERLPETTRPAT